MEEEGEEREGGEGGRQTDQGAPGGGGGVTVQAAAGENAYLDNHLVSHLFSGFEIKRNSCILNLCSSAIFSKTSNFLFSFCFSKRKTSFVFLASYCQVSIYLIYTIYNSIYSFIPE